MSISKKIKNNRTRQKNAKKSTGPKTARGKEKASQNAVKHGLYAKSVIINSPHLNENPEEYEQLLQSLIDEFDPQTAYEQHLIEKIANCMWRQRRVAIAETAQINAQMDEVDRKMNSKRRDLRLFYEYEEDEDPLGEPEDVERMRSILAGKRSIPEEDFSITLLRYEMRLDRQLTRAFDLLLKLENRRNRMKDRQDAKDARTQPQVIPANAGNQGKMDPCVRREDEKKRDDGTAENDGTCKNDETKLDRGKPHGGLEDVVIFTDG